LKIRFVPDLDDIVKFEEMVVEGTFSEETKISSRYVTVAAYSIYMLIVQLI